MAKILLIISALVIAATAYLGFATKQKVDALQTEFSSTKKTLGAKELELTKTKGTLKKTEDELVAAKATIDEKEKEIAAKKGEIDKLTTDLAKVTEDLTTTKAKLDDLMKIGDPSGLPGVDVEQMKKDISALRESKAKAEADLAEAKQIAEGLTKKLNDEKSKTMSAETQVRAYKEDYTKPGVTGTILAYNPGWNFVVLSIGDRQSVKVGKELVVTRDGQMVGKARVTSVEPGTSIADIIPSSVPKGQSVQPGDRVVYEGRAK